MSLVKDQNGNVLNPPIKTKHRYGADGMTLDWFDTHPRPLPEIRVPQSVIDHLANDPTYPKGVVKLIPTSEVEPIPGTVTTIETLAKKFEEVAVYDSENLPIESELPRT